MDNPRKPIGDSDFQNQYRKQQPRNAGNQQKNVPSRQNTSAQRPNSQRYAENSASGARANSSSRSRVQGDQAQRKTNPNEMTPEMIRQEKKKAAKRKMIFYNTMRVCAIMAVVVTISVLLASVAISCVNDVLAIHISEKNNTKASVVIVDGMNTSDVIDALDDAGVIKNAWFCKLAAEFIGYSDEGYIARTYELNRSMGLENMLNEIKNNTSKTAKTVTLTFPEGYTADQIIEMLEENKVCSRAAIIEAMNSIDFSNDFKFLTSVSDAESRYMKLEGYLFPDTYDFYIGEAADSVIKKFLTNFNNKWTDDYAQAAQDLGLTVDQVVKLASVVEKEAVGADMPVVGSILHNRLDAGMRLECDSTSSYIASNKSGLAQNEIDAYNSLYDTYICSSMPIGAICNPGNESLEAVLFAPDTDYYYFIHDVNNEFHVAKTYSEQEYNIATYGLAE